MMRMFVMTVQQKQLIILVRMGCTSTVIVETRKVVPLPPEIINSYIDKFPAIILLKLKEKFDCFANRETKDLSLAGFLKLYSSALISQDVQRRLFTYFTDRQNNNIKFRQFVVKYATIVKCEPNVLYNILFELYKESLERDLMNDMQFANFLKSEKEYLLKVPESPQFPLSLEKFSEYLAGAAFAVEVYQTRLVITTEEDVPFKLINKELATCDFNDFVPGEEYCLLSNAWFYRWSFYYQDVDHTLQMQQIKSTKILPSDSFGKRYNRRKESNAHERKMNDSLRSSQIGNTLVQQPKTIQFDDIEGQYRGQLKQNLKISAQVKIITMNLWKMLSSLHPAEQQFKRRAVNMETLEYYPKAVYYIEANERGQFLAVTQEIKFLSHTDMVFTLKNKLSDSIFTKHFGQKTWREIENDQSLAEVSLQPRFFIAIAANRAKFIEKTTRKDVSRENLQLGDKIYASFALGGNSQAEIIGINGDNYFKVHFKGHSYRYQRELARDEISVMEEEDSPKKKDGGLIKGIPNIGNTCFMNSIIQCLVATPVLQNFLLDYSFDEKKEPIGFGLSSLARSLLKNERAFPQQFKRMIDIHLPLFSGFDQHDAQEFLNVLLDKLNDQIKQKPTVIDYLFGGKIQSKLTCSACSALKTIQEKMYILSLPIPEPEFNYFSIIVVPVTSKVLKKIIFKLHRNALVADYCKAFQDRIGTNKKDFLFVQTSYNSLKKVKNEILIPALQNKLITQVGIVPNISLLAFEKLPFQFYLDLLSKKGVTVYRDFQSKPQAAWTICKIIEQKNEMGTMTIEYLTTEGDVQKVKIDKQSFKELSTKLGSQSDISYKKIIQRKYNASLKRVQNFGLQLLAGVPKWASYNDLLAIVERYVENLKQRDAKMFQDEQRSYIIRFLDPTKFRCIFCQAQVLIFNVEQNSLKNCCEISEKEAPINWVAKSKNFWVYVDWIDFSKCNVGFSTYIDVDPQSKIVESSKQDVHINLDACIRLHSQSEVVEMECDKCKEKYQKLQHLIGSMPNILVVHMKQFRYTSQGHLIKLDLRLRWQEFLDSSKYAMASNGKLYELYALVKHNGNSQSGHYTCMAKRKHPFENKKVWVNFDDDTATIIKQQEKIIDDAYLLFYKKVDMPTSSLVIYSDLNNP